MMGIKKSLQRGFTIVEILIVVIVVGILAAIVIVSYNSSQRNAQDTRTTAMISSATQALDAHKTAKGTFPPTESGLFGEARCIGTDYKNGTCGGKRHTGDCSAYELQLKEWYGPEATLPDYQVQPSPTFTQTLKQLIGIEIPTIEHPEISYSQPVNDTCTLETYFTGPQYTNYCKIGIYEDRPFSYQFGGCGGEKAYQIIYAINEKSSDCKLPRSYDMTSWHTGDFNGTICAVIRGDVVTCSDTYCPEMD